MKGSILSASNATSWSTGRMSTMCFSLLLAACLCAMATQMFIMGGRPLMLTLDCNELERVGIAAAKNETHLAKQLENHHQLLAQVESLQHQLKEREQSSSRPIIEVISHPVTLDRVAILGERNSGTNLVEMLLKNNFHDDSVAVQPGLLQIKHYFQPWHPFGEADTARTLILMVVRNPYDWLQSMHDMCYCCEDINSLNLSFEEFITAPFNTTPVDPVTFEKRPSEGCPNDINIYKSEGRGFFRSIMHARYEKMIHFLNFSSISAGFQIVPHEHVLDSFGQEVWLEQLAAKWNLPWQKEKDGFHPVVKDARFWKEESEDSYYKLENRIARSMYLNKTLVTVDEKANENCRLVNLVIDEYYEQIMGYTMLDC